MFFKGAVPNTEALISQKKSFMRYYFNYILASSIIWTVLAISNFMMYLNCAKLHLPLLNIFVTICTMAKVATPIVLSIMRYYDPSIRNKLIKLFYKVFTKRRTQSTLYLVI
jgi:1-phosphatidylinositol-4-phosphate 5-kinase